MNEENVSFEELLNASMESNKKIEKIVNGKVISVTSNGEIFVDFNYKADGIVPKNEYSFDEEADPKDEFKPGDSITCEVIGHDQNGNVLLSYKKMKKQETLKKFEEKVNNNEIFEEKVKSANDKGVIVDYQGIRIFIPNSLACGQKERIRFRVIEYKPNEHRIIGSARVVVEEEKKRLEEAFWSNVEVDKEYEGTVSSVCSYGAFVNVDGVDGLLHISEISWNRNANANDLLKQGQKIKVRIKDIDKENKRFKLSYDGKGENPWDNIGINVGDVIKVKIKKLATFGAFAEIKEGVEGLIHISQISTERITKPEDKLEVNEEVNVKVINIDMKNKKIELSIRELEGTINEYSSREKGNE